ncbi:MAG: hypothetical protein D6725_16795 [Planctomycetota bacterium]|nr:MAG: hypothetical protein D6725_16795 [Planctomycetota bacterium]
MHKAMPTNFFERKDRWGNGLSLWVLVAMVALMPPMAMGLSRLRLHNDIRQWLPPEAPEARTYAWFREHFGQQDRVVVSWDDASLNDPRVRWLERRLEGIRDAYGIRREGVRYVEEVTTPIEIIAEMERQKIPRDEAIRRLSGVLVGRGPLRVRLTQEGRARRRFVEREIARRLNAELGLQATVAPAYRVPAVDEHLLARLRRSLPTYAAAPSGETGAGADAARADALVEAAFPLFPPADFVFVKFPEHEFSVRIDWGRQRASEAVWARVIEVVRSIDGAAPTALTPAAVREPEASGGDVRQPLVADCFRVPGAPVAVSIVLSEAGKADLPAALEAIRRAASAVGIPPESLHMGGRPVATVALDAAVKRAAWNRSAAWYRLHERSVILLSALIGTFLAFVLLKNAWLTVLVLAASYFGVLVTVAAIPLSAGTMNMVLVVMPTLLLVLALSGSIHIGNYWKYALRQHPHRAVAYAYELGRSPCTLASVTTAIGLASLMISDLEPVRQFGLYSAVGCLIGLAVVLFGLPSLLQFWSCRPQVVANADPTFWRWMSRGLAARRNAVLVAAAVLVGVSACGLRYFRTETKVIHYFSPDARIVRDYRFLEDNLSGITPVEIVIRFDQTAQKRLNIAERAAVVREVEAHLRAHPDISGCLSLADLLPVIERPKADEGRRRGGVLGNLLSRNTRAVVAYNKRVFELNKRLRGELAERVRPFYVVAAEPGDLFASGDRLLNRAGDELWHITAQASVLSDLNYAEIANVEQTGSLDTLIATVTRRHPGIHHVVTGMVPLFLKTQKMVLDGLIASFALAFVAIGLVITVVLGNPLAAALTMVPNVVPVVVVFGLISWCGMPVDIGTMITASVALGIAVDGTLHMITWFQQSVRYGRDRREAVTAALVHCGPAMWQTSVIIGVGLLALSLSELRLVSRFGGLMSLLIGAALLADIVLMPALLAGPLGRLLGRDRPAQRGVEQRSEGEASEEEMVAASPTGPGRPHFPMSAGTPTASE